MLQQSHILHKNTSACWWFKLATGLRNALRRWGWGNGPCLEGCTGLVPSLIYVFSILTFPWDHLCIDRICNCTEGWKRTLGRCLQHWGLRCICEACGRCGSKDMHAKFGSQIKIILKWLIKKRDTSLWIKHIMYLWGCGYNGTWKFEKCRLHCKKWMFMPCVVVLQRMGYV